MKVVKCLNAPKQVYIMKRIKQINRWFVIRIITGLLFISAGCTGTRPEKPSDWVDQYLRSMSLEQKIGAGPRAI